MISMGVDLRTYILLKQHSSMVKLKPLLRFNDIEPELNMSRLEILNVIDKWVSEGSGWVID